MVSTGAARDVLGRDEELAAIGAFLEDGPLPAALVLEGEAGIGKTALWLRAIEHAGALSHTVLSSRPAESDEQLSFAGLGDLLAGVLDDVLAELPSPQRSALEVALLLADAPEQPSDRRTIASAFLSALRGLARDRPVLVAIDDAQWLDPPSAQVVSFAARRLRAEPVRLLVAARSERRGRAPLGLARALPEHVETLALGPLSLGALHGLLRMRLGASFARPTLRRLHEACAGNPFHALEIARALQERGESVDLGGPLPIPEDVDELVAQRLRVLPAPVREALLAAAVSAEATTQLIESVLGRRTDLQAAIDAKVITVRAGQIQFVHPLFAMAIQQQAGEERTREMHLRLAQHARKAEERALHLALGTAGPDDAAASTLAEAARASRARGAPLAAVAFLEHSLRLSRPDLPERGRWEIELADACFEAGDAARAAGLLTELSDRLTAGPERAAVLMQLAMVKRASHTPPAVWLEVAERALPEAAGVPELQAAIHAELSWAALFVNDLEGALAHARTAARLSEPLDDAEVAAQALDCLLYMELTAGIPSSPELIDRSLERERAAKHLFVEHSPSLGRGFQLCTAGDLAAARTHLVRVERFARERGDESGLAVVCGTLTTLETLAGNWREAEAYAEETVELAEHTGVNWHESLHARALLDAHLGRVSPALRAARELITDAEAGGSLVYLVRSLSLLGFVELSRGELPAAHAALRRATDAAATLGIGEPGLLRCVADHAETLIAIAEHDEAELVIERFERMAAELGRAWAQATSERCRGLIIAGRGEPTAALATLERATAAHRRCSMPLELGRTLLALGATQRRAAQRRAARASLAEALAVFERLGASLWADKARAELGRIGGRTPAGEKLTPSEARIAELVARGYTNREVAAELVIAVHTVEAALTRIYAKLGARSRTELTRQLAERRPDGPAPS